MNVADSENKSFSGFFRKHKSRIAIVTLGVLAIGITAVIVVHGKSANDKVTREEGNKGETVEKAKEASNNNKGKSDSTTDTKGKSDGITDTRKPTQEKAKNQSFSASSAFSSHPNFSKLSVCALNSESFCTSHLKFLNTVLAVLESEEGTVSASDKKALDVTFSEAKSLFNTVIGADELLSRVYGAPDGTEAAAIMLDIDSIDLESELKNLTDFPEGIPAVRLIYDSLSGSSLLGKRDALFSTCSLTFNNYEEECYRFFECLYYKKYKDEIDTVLRDYLFRELSVSTDSFESVVSWWQSFRIPQKENTYHLPYQEYLASDINNWVPARKFALQDYLNSWISAWIGSTKSKNDLEEVYVRYRMSSAFELPPTLNELVEKYYMPIPTVFPVDQAVLSTPPRSLLWKDRSCYASSYFQCMANFLPLYRKVPEWNQESNFGSYSKNYRDIIEKVAISDVKDEPLLNVVSLMKWSSIMDGGGLSFQLHNLFLSDVGSSGLGLNKIFGLAIDNQEEAKEAIYFPPNTMMSSLPGMEVQGIRMTGHVLVTWLESGNRISDSRDARFYEPFELLPVLQVPMVGGSTLGRYELYAFIVAQKMGIPHLVAYVRRADGQWWFCDDLAGANKKVSLDELLTTIEKQRELSKTLMQRPIMAFYLLTSK